MYAIAPVALTAYFTTDCTSALGGGNEQSGVVEGIGDAAGQGVVSTDVLPPAVVVVFAVALVATAVVLYRCVGRPDGRDGRGRRGGGTRPAGRQGPGSRPGRRGPTDWRNVTPTWTTRCTPRGAT